MHPLLADRQRWQLFLGAWGGVGVAVSVLTHALLVPGWTESGLFGVPIGLAAGPISLSAWYICRAMPLATTPPSRVATTAVSAALVTAVAWAGLGLGWWSLLALGGIALPPLHPPVLLPMLIGVGAFAYLLALAVTYLIDTFEASAAAARRALEFEVAQRDAELAALRAQLDPHFLFNSLNSISGLITVAPDRARVMCQLLGDFLRDCLKLGGTPRISLEREVALASQYLRIEQVRFGERLCLSTDVAPESATVPVPPLLVQPLVENAVRHGIATRLDGGTIEVTTRRIGARAVVTVRNPRDEDSPRPGTGLGLSLVRRRLQAAYGDAAALTIEPGPETYQVTLTLPIDAIEGIRQTAPGGHAHDR
jgi:signal transduction histidine kinase